MIPEIRKTDYSDEPELLHLYKIVAEVPAGIIRKGHEINQNYISEFVQKSINNGLSLVALIDNEIIGEIHAYTPNLFAFQHMLTDLTIVVNPNYHGRGIGRKLFESFLAIVKSEMTHILRIELYTREQNERNVKFYKSLGFVNEGRQMNKIFNSASKFETPLHMAWFNPNYNNGVTTSFA